MKRYVVAVVLALAFSSAALADGAGVWSQTSGVEFETCQLRNVDTTTAPDEVCLSGAYSPDEDTVLLLHCNEKTGGPKDSSPKKAQLTATDAEWIENGRFGGAMKLNGKTHVFGPPKPAHLDLTDGKLTVEMWVNIPAYPRESYFALLGTHGYASGYRVAITPSKYRQPGKVVFQVGGKTEKRSFTTRGRIPTEGWHHVAVSYDSSLKKDNTKMYIDGLLDSKFDCRQPITTSTAFRIGQSGGLGGLVGALDEIRISNRARTPDEFSISEKSLYFESGEIVSPKINAKPENVASVRLGWNVKVPEKGAVLFYATNDGGKSWHQILQKDKPFKFPAPGNDLRVKAVLTRGYGTPILHDWQANFSYK